MKTTATTEIGGSYEPLTLQSANPFEQFCPRQWSGWNVGDNRWLDHFHKAIEEGDNQRLKGLIMLGLDSSTSHSDARNPDWSFQKRVQFYMRLCYGVHDETFFFAHNKLDPAGQPSRAWQSYEMAKVVLNMLCDFYFGPYSPSSINYMRWGGRYGGWISNLLEDEMIENIVSFFVSDKMELQNHYYYEFPKHREPMLCGFMESLAKIVFTFSAVKFLGEERGLSEEGIALQKRVFALQPKCLVLVAKGRWWHLVSSPESRLCKDALLELKRMALKQRYIRVGDRADYSRTTIRKAIANNDPAGIALLAYNAKLMEVRRLCKKEVRVQAKRFV
jgi:hypothetical protein